MFLGIDQSLSCTGLSVLGEGTSIIGFAYPNKWSKKYSATGGSRLSYYRKVLKGICEKYSIEYVAWESYAFAQREASRSFAIGELGGVIRQLLNELSTPMIQIAPSQLKKWAGHKTPKEIMTGKGLCRCGGQIIKPRKAGQALSTKKKKAPNKKELEANWLCNDCGKSYDEKDMVIRFITAKYGEPWNPLRLENIGPRAKRERENAENKVLSDLCDATVLAEVCRSHFGGTGSMDFTPQQREILQVIREQNS